MTTQIRPHRRGGVGRLDFADGGRVDADVVVFATGVRPRDELARDAGLEIGERGGDRRRRHLPDQRPRHLGRRRGRLHRGPPHRAGRPRLHDGRDRRRPAARRRRRRSPAPTPRPSSSSPGVDVASFGDAFGETPGALEVVYADPVAGVYKKLVMSDDARTLLGGVLVGDASAYAEPAPDARRASCRATRPRSCCPRAAAARPSWSCPTTPPSARATTSRPARSAAPSPSTAAPTSARSRRAPRPAPAAARACRWSRSWSPPSWRAQGIEVSTALCEHFALSRAQLFDVVRVSGAASFSEIIERFGTRAGPRLRHLPAGGRLDPGVARHRRTSSTASRPRCRTPTTT